MTEPTPIVNRAVAFIDGQNLYHSAKRHFGYNEANYDAPALARAICALKGWDLVQTRFYTGIHKIEKKPNLHHYWKQKLMVMGTRQNLVVFSRPLRYQTDAATGFFSAQEKGIDVRIALDIVRLANEGAYDVALIFSRDQDLSEASKDVKAIAQKQGRWIKVASAFPDSTGQERGIHETDWIRIERSLYDTCLDTNDYWPRTAPTPVA